MKKKKKWKQILRDMRLNIAVFVILLALIIFGRQIIRISLLENAQETGTALTRSYAAEERGNLEVYENLLAFGVATLDDLIDQGYTRPELMAWMERYFNRLQYILGEDVVTPYLILDGDMEDALIYAGERGVDVRIILPGIPDKVSPYALAYTHYRRLLDAGVKLYQYTPGFVHAKVFLSDDREAVVGTINLDYRSLYHHFECAAYLYGTTCLPDIARDFGETLQKCQRVTRESMKQEPLMRKVMGPLLKAFAPLL